MQSVMVARFMHDLAVADLKNVRDLHHKGRFANLAYVADRKTQLHLVTRMRTQELEEAQHRENYYKALLDQAKAAAKAAAEAKAKAKAEAKANKEAAE